MFTLDYTDVHNERLSLMLVFNWFYKAILMLVVQMFFSLAKRTLATYIIYLNIRHMVNSLIRFSLHGFNPELWPLTLTWGISRAADTLLWYRHTFSFWKTSTPTPPVEAQFGEKKPCWQADAHMKGMMRLQLLFRCFCAYVSDRSAGGSAWWWIRWRCSLYSNSLVSLMSSEVIWVFIGNVLVLKWAYTSTNTSAS